MMNLIIQELANAHVRLVPLQESHRAAVNVAASIEPEGFAWWPRAMTTPQERDETFTWLLGEQAKGTWLPFTVIAPNGEIVGQTCYLNPVAEHERVEVGGTWYAPAARGTAINPAAKLLMLGHAFTCGAGRVELKTDALNARSRAAMLKMGAQFEGIHRRHMLMPGNRWRDTAWFSVIAKEWPNVKAGLEARLG
jgi:N-acetyltransferase